MTEVDRQRGERLEATAKAAANKWNELGNYPSPSWEDASEEFRRDWRAVMDAALKAYRGAWVYEFPSQKNWPT